MYSRFLSVGGMLLAFATLSHARVLRVCADPNNLPFSNEAQEGFENRIAGILARDLNATLEYVWWPERKSFVEKTLNQHRCDLLIGVPSALEAVLTTPPYYRSTYVFISRRDRQLAISSLDDPRLNRWRIGIHVVGDDYAPPAVALARRGLSGNLAAYSLFGAADEANPPAKLISAVANGDVDVAIAWGPLAGYFSQHASHPLEITPVSPAMFLAVPFTFDISMAVRNDDRPLLSDINLSLRRNCGAIQRVLAEYGVPQVKESQPLCDASLPQRSSLSR